MTTVGKTKLRKRPNLMNMVETSENKLKSYKQKENEAKKVLEEKLDKRKVNLNTRKQFKEAELRNNLKLEYDRLAGESLLIPKLKQTHGDKYAENVSKALGRRLEDLRKMYKQSVKPVEHAIARK